MEFGDDFILLDHPTSCTLFATFSLQISSSCFISSPVSSVIYSYTAWYQLAQVFFEIIFPSTITNIA